MKLSMNILCKGESFILIEGVLNMTNLTTKQLIYGQSKQFNDKTGELVHSFVIFV